MKKLFRIAMVFSLLLPFLLGAKNVYAETVDSVLKNEGTVYDDLNQDYGIVGIASQFHIFDKGTTTIQVHTNGNIATANLNAKVNFGTNIHEGNVTKDLSYFQKVEHIESSADVQSTSSRSNKMVLGKDVQVSIDSNEKKVKINEVKLDHVAMNEVFQDTTAPYIDFGAEFKKIGQASEELFRQTANQTIKLSSFTDLNNRTIDLSKESTKIVYIDLDADVLEQNTPLKICNSNNLQVVINVKNVPSNLKIGSQIIYNNRLNHETEDFSDANLSWNFGEKDDTITVNSPFQGTIIAPNSKVDVYQNLDGSVIGTNVSILGGESHRWDSRPLKPENNQQEADGSVLLKKIDASDANKTLTGAVFNLYTADGTLIQENITTGVDGTVQVDHLKAGDYYFVETKAPEGYDVNDTKQAFTIKENTSKTVETITVTNKKIEEKEATGTLILEKVDRINPSIKLQGAVYGLYDHNGQLVWKLVTGTDGTAKKDELALGDYYVKEIEAPIGYTIDPEKYPVQIQLQSVESRIVHKQVSDTKKVVENADGSVLLKKVDASDTNKTLTGAVFNLYTVDGTLIQENITTGVDGTVQVDHLKAGDYYFVETKAPEGYVLNEQHVAFTIRLTEQSYVTNVIVKNEKELTDREKELPYTGGEIITSLLISIFGLMILISVASIKFIKK